MTARDNVEAAAELQALTANPGLLNALEYPLVQSILDRRSRRFGLGMEIPVGALGFKSQHDPVPLSELEEALLVWAATGLTGLALSDLPPEFGLSAIVQWVSRTWPSSCNNHGTELFFTNDDGVYMAKVRDMLPKDQEIDMFMGLSPEEKTELVLFLYRQSLVKLADGRADLPTELPGLFDFNQWDTNKPGTTLFMPVTDMTTEYINLLFIYISRGYGFNFVDPLFGNRWCGTEKWVESGYLGDALRMSLIELELRVITMLIVEQAFMAQNLNLMMQAMGLGGWTFTGFVARFAMGGVPQYKGLGFRYEAPRPGSYFEGAPTFPVGLDGIYEIWAPPYYKDMHAAVDAFVEQKWAYWEEDQPHPFRDYPSINQTTPRPSQRRTEVVKDICQYIYETYGRFPAFLDPMYFRLTIQAQHIDLDFYDAKFPAGAYTEQHKNHFRLWHPELPDPFPDHR